MRLIPQNQFKKEINAFVYIKVLKWLNANGIEILDYMGANMRSIAEFKARYNPTLKPYYIVKHTINGKKFLNELKAFVRAFFIKNLEY
ncbi:hypothetical protein BCY91_13235 [Pelobium manganitolerans]|uniref:Uncharacterized protein n=1 Tax=Pelobium manganitolerans TaxID=1842495 RepID=A0A419SAU5_9SPHI|nr:hypothetical protein BCY91_13235 [Pelobium manganitolerans]